MFGVGCVCYFIGWLTIPVPHASTISAAAGGIGTLLLLAAVIAWLVIKLRNHNAPYTTDVMRGLTLTALSIFFPFGVVALASSGGTLNSFSHGSGYNWQPWLIHLLSGILIWMLYLILIELPYYLYRHAPQPQVSEQTRSLLPAWGSGIAALLTGFLIIDLHFAHGPLANIAIAPLIISALAVGALLLPFFKWVIAKLWTFGVIGTLSFSRWKKVISNVISDIQPIIKPRLLSMHIEQCEECQDHAKNCDECRAELAKLQSVGRELEAAPDVRQEQEHLPWLTAAVPL